MPSIAFAPLRRGLLLSLLLLLAFAPAVAQPAALSLRSEKAHFTLRVTGIGRPERLNHLHGFDLQLADAAGRPLSGATIALTGLREDSNSPLPTAPRVAPAPGNGQYRAEGLRFHMPGEWRLIFSIDSGGIRDRAILSIIVK